MSSYDDGAFIEVTMDNLLSENAFSFKTSCQTVENKCEVTSPASCFNISVVDSYDCQLKKVLATDS